MVHAAHRVLLAIFSIRPSSTVKPVARVASLVILDNFARCAEVAFTFFLQMIQLTNVFRTVVPKNMRVLLVHLVSHVFILALTVLRLYSV